MSVPDGPDFTVVYDGEDGEVHVDYGTGITQAIEVRQGMIDQAVRHAAVVELERLGYTVIPPRDSAASSIPDQPELPYPKAAS